MGCRSISKRAHFADMQRIDVWRLARWATRHQEAALRVPDSYSCRWRSSETSPRTESHDLVQGVNQTSLSLHVVLVNVHEMCSGPAAGDLCPTVEVARSLGRTDSLGSWELADWLLSLAQVYASTRAFSCRLPAGHLACTRVASASSLAPEIRPPGARRSPGRTMVVPSPKGDVP